MTAPNGAIVFNNSTGSDTTASGMGSANVYGAGASITSASAVVTGINTTGVAAGDLLWVQSSTGRQFSIIASVDSSTQVTCDDNFDVTESSRTWAIGGKRATLANAEQLFNTTYNTMSEKEVVLETDQTLSEFSLNAPGGRNVIRSDVEGTKRKITFSGQYPVRGSWWIFYDIEFESTYGSGSAVFYSSGSTTIWNTYVECYRCDFVSSTNQFDQLYQNGRSGALIFYKCRFHNFSVSYILNYTTGIFLKCHFKDNTSTYLLHTTGGYTGDVKECIFENNSSLFRFRNGYSGAFDSNILYGNAGTMFGRVVGGYDRISNCIFVNNTSGFTGWDDGAGNQFRSFNNAFYNNTDIDASSGFALDNVDLTADPFVDAANGDFNLNATNGGGGTLRSTNYTLGG